MKDKNTLHTAFLNVFFRTNLSQFLPSYFNTWLSICITEANDGVKVIYGIYHFHCDKAAQFTNISVAAAKCVLMISVLIMIFISI